MPIYRTSTDDGEPPRSGDIPINERPEAESAPTSGCGCGCMIFVALVLLVGAVVLLA